MSNPLEVMPYSWIAYFLDVADVVANKSKDPTTKVGCVMVDPEYKRILGTGYNGFPKDVHDSVDFYGSRYERANKLMFTSHAEANAITAAAMHGVPLKDTYAFVTLPPCLECTRLLIQSGVKAVFFHELSIESKPPVNVGAVDWRNKIALAVRIAFEADLKLYSFCKETGSVTEVKPSDDESRIMVKSNCIRRIVEHMKQFKSITQSVQLISAKSKCEHDITVVKPFIDGSEHVSSPLVTFSGTMNSSGDFDAGNITYRPFGYEKGDSYVFTVTLRRIGDSRSDRLVDGRECCKHQEVICNCYEFEFEEAPSETPHVLLLMEKPIRAKTLTDVVLKLK